jgi:hypothetical protein
MSLIKYFNHYIQPEVEKLERLLGYNHVYIVNYPNEDSVHVRRVRHIPVFDEDLYFMNVFKDGQWEKEYDMNEVPF